MNVRKPSFFERLTGSIRIQDDVSDYIPAPKNTRPLYDDDDSDDDYLNQTHAHTMRNLSVTSDDETGVLDEPESIAELAVDVYSDDQNIYIQTMTAGVRKEDLEISISREQVTIRGSREQDTGTYDMEYMTNELYWGAFERVINLPDEIDIELARAVENHGLVTITMPKFDKQRQTVLQVQ